MIKQAQVLRPVTASSEFTITYKKATVYVRITEEQDKRGMGPLTVVYFSLAKGAPVDRSDVSRLLITPWSPAYTEEKATKIVKTMLKMKGIPYLEAISGVQAIPTKPAPVVVGPKVFVDSPVTIARVWADPKYTAKANSFVAKAKTKFDFRINVLTSKLVGTMYLLKPADTIVFQKMPNLNMVVHELAHHVYHKLLTAAERKTVVTLCAVDKTVDPNEQFATTAELLVCGKAARFDLGKGQEVSVALASNPKLVKLVAKFYAI